MLINAAKLGPAQKRSCLSKYFQADHGHHFKPSQVGRLDVGDQLNMILDWRMGMMEIIKIEDDENGHFVDASTGATMDFDGIEEEGYYYEDGGEWFGPFMTHSEAVADIARING